MKPCIMIAAKRSMVPSVSRARMAAQSSKAPSRLAEASAPSVAAWHLPGPR
jgi:hypothetical protein